MHNGAGTHWTWLLGYVEIAVVEPPIPKRGFRGGKSEHFRVRGGVFEHLDLIESPGDNLAFMNDHGSNRDLSRFVGLLSLS